MKKCVLVLSALVLIAAGGCGDGIHYDSVHSRPPGCWRPYLQPERPILNQRDIGKNTVVITSRNRDKLVVYDRDEDRWQEYMVPKGHRVEVSHPHIWWTTSTANGKYWNLKSGVAWNTKTDRRIKLAYTDHIWFHDGYSYAYIGNVFHRALQAAFLQTLVAK